MSLIVDIYGGDYEHVLELARTREDIDLRYITRPANDIFATMLRDQAYEVCEFSLSNYIMLKDRGADWLDAIPVFPYRAFRHATLHVQNDSPLRQPADLRGKLIGVLDYSMTAAVWTRGILGQQYGVHWSELRWVASGPQRFPTPQGVSVDIIDRDLEAELIAGRIDALLSPSTKDERRPAGERQLRPLLDDPQSAEEEYLRNYGGYPINHTVVVRSDIRTRNPALPRILYDAYSDAKARAYKRQLGTTLVPWGRRHWQTVFDLFDGDPLPYGLTPGNQAEVQRLADFLYEQKLVSQRISATALFLPENEYLSQPPDN